MISTVGKKPCAQKEKKIVGERGIPSSSKKADYKIDVRKISKSMSDLMYGAVARFVVRDEARLAKRIWEITECTIAYWRIRHIGS